MIQAPQLNYAPQHPGQTVYRQGADVPVQTQNMQAPGYVYNYPAASSYMPQGAPAAPPVKYNGVNIGIKNPQGQPAGQPLGQYLNAYGMPAQNLMPAQFYPVQQPQGQYNGVNIEILNPQGQGQPAGQPFAQPFAQSFNAYGMPAQTLMPAQFYPAQQLMQGYPQMPQNPAPEKTDIPASLQAQPKAPDVPEPVIKETENTLPAEPAAQAPAVDAPVIPASSLNPESFAGRLRNSDTEIQKAAIEEIAEKVKNSEQDGPVLLDSQIFDALTDIINKDTSSLPGPSPEVLELRQKDPEYLTASELEKLAPSPLEKAEINKQYALYTISYMQERLNKELEKMNGRPLDLKDLPCIDTVVDTAKSNPNPMLRIGALAALFHIARPEYKEDLEIIFQLAKDDEDERVREAAMKAERNMELAGNIERKETA